MSIRTPQQTGNWAALALHLNFPWPEEQTPLVYRGHNLWLIPATEDTYPMVAVELTSEEIAEADGYRLLRRFISSLVWMEGRRARIAGAMGGSSPGRMVMPDIHRPMRSAHPVHFDNLPEPTEQRAKLALALYREALEAENIAYRFLGFYKIINVIHERGPEQKDWINANLGAVRGRAKERKDQLLSRGEDVGEYLYNSGRCAVAHAYSEPVVDPDEPDDYRRLHEDGPLMRELAELAIEQELGVKSAGTIYREHLYELAGFRELFGQDVIKLIVSGTLPDQGITVPDPPRMSIRLRDLPHFAALENMDVAIEGLAQSGVVTMLCTKAENIVHAYLFLDFPNERLHIDVEGGFAVFDNGTAQAAQYAADVMRFKGRYIANGSLEVWDADAGTLLGRCDPLIPTNIDPGATLRNLDRHADEFDDLARKRQTDTDG